MEISLTAALRYQSGDQLHIVIYVLVPFGRYPHIKFLTPRLFSASMHRREHVPGCQLYDIQCLPKDILRVQVWHAQITGGHQKRYYNYVIMSSVSELRQKYGERGIIRFLYWLWKIYTMGWER